MGLFLGRTCHGITPNANHKWEKMSVWILATYLNNSDGSVTFSRNITFLRLRNSLMRQWCRGSEDGEKKKTDQAQ